MATFSILMPLIIVALLFSPSLSSSSSSSSSSLPLKPKLHTPTNTIAAAPTILPINPPLMSPYSELSPDVSPLFPSPGSSTIPTIPSNPSPPNPDEVSSVGPDPAFTPSGLLQASSAMHLIRDSTVLLKLLISFTALWLLQAFAL